VKFTGVYGRLLFVCVRPFVGILLADNQLEDLLLLSKVYIFRSWYISVNLLTEKQGLVLERIAVMIFDFVSLSFYSPELSVPNLYIFLVTQHSVAFISKNTVYLSVNTQLDNRPILL
jgi:hypothetical protein